MLFFRGMGNGVVFLKPLRGLFFFAKKSSNRPLMLLYPENPDRIHTSVLHKARGLPRFWEILLVFPKIKGAFPKTSIAADIALENVVGKLFP